MCLIMGIYKCICTRYVCTNIVYCIFDSETIHLIQMTKKKIYIFLYEYILQNLHSYLSSTKLLKHMKIKLLKE